jgi:hypothetical protein
MRKTRWSWGLALAGLVVAGWGVALAQTPGAPAAQPNVMLAQADALIGRMGVTSATIRRQLEQARSSRDVVKTLCLSDKLNQIDVALRSAQERRAKLESALARHDQELANHEATILGTMGRRSSELAGEANQCIGQDAFYVGRSQVTTTIDPNLPRTDPTAPPDNAAIVVTPPPCASCVR